MKCKTCRIEKPESMFYKHPYVAGGRLDMCKECRRVYMAKWRKNNRKKYNKMVGDWMRGRKVDPKKIKAKSIARRIKRNMEKVECSYPGGVCSGRIEAHHWDYDKPEEIVIFCKKHHVLVDRVARLLRKQRSLKN